MTAYALSPGFGALAGESDRRFRRLLAGFALPALIAGIIIPFVQVSGLLKGGGLITPTRYAKLLEQAPAIEEPQTVEKKEVLPKPKPQLTQEQKVERARKRAEKALASLTDQLSELRDTNLPTVNTPLTGNVITSASSTAPSFAAAAARTSGGIGEVGVVERKESTTGLGERKTTTVKSTIGAGADASRAGLGGDKLKSGRTLEEIQLVFDRNKGAFYTMYVREQRQHPNMVGKLVVRMTIAPSGRVTRCTIVSSELNNPEFEKKVVARVLLLDFGAKDVGDFTLDYPILFFPS
jgi:TonB family protein